MPNNVVEIIIAAKDHASGAVVGAVNRMNQATQAYHNTLQAFNGHTAQAVQGLMNLVGAASAVYAVTNAFKAGIKEVDDYKLATIGIAATLTDMAEAGSGDLKKIYDNNLVYAEATYKRVELAAAKFFASGKEMVQAWQILTQQGIVISTDEDIKNMGIITDKIKLATQGQASSLQIATELRDVMRGQADANSVVAAELKTRLGPEWAKILKTAKEHGTALEFVASQYKGLTYASKDVENTLEGQSSTLATLLGMVGKEGLSGAYSDIVGWLREANDYLREHGAEISGKIQTGWLSVRESIQKARNLLEEISAFSKDNPIASNWISSIVTFTAEAALSLYVLRKLWEIGKVLFAPLAASMTFVTTLFSGLGAAVAGVFATIGAAIMASPLGWAAGAILVISAALLAMPVMEWAGNWQVAGLKIKEWLDIIGLKIENLYLKFKMLDFTQYMKDALGGFLLWFDTEVGALLNKLIDKLQSFPGKVWKLLNTEMPGGSPGGPLPAPVGSPGGPATREQQNAMMQAQYAANEAAINAYMVQAKGEISAAEQQLRKAEADLEAHMKKIYTTPKIKTPSFEDEAESRKRLKLEEDIVKASIKLEEARAGIKIALLDKETNAVQESYSRNLITAEEFAKKTIELQTQGTQIKIESLKKEEAARVEMLGKQWQAAKTPREREKIELEVSVTRTDTESKVVSFQNKLEEQKRGIEAGTRKELEDRKQFDAELVNSRVSALQDILADEKLSAEERLQLNAQYLEARKAQIKEEQGEIWKKTYDTVLAEKWADTQIRAIKSDLRTVNLQVLSQMLADERTTAEERVRIWTEVDRSITENQMGSWDAFGFGARKAIEDWGSATKQMQQAGNNFMNNFRDGFSSLFDKLFKGELRKASDLWNAFCDMLSSVFQDLLKDMTKSWMSQIVKGIFDKLPGLLGGLLGGGGGGNDWSYGFGAGPGIGAGDLKFAQGGITSFLTQPIALATGGVVSRPTLAWVGEGQHREAVVPLPDGRSIPAIITEPKATESSSGRPVNVVLNFENKTNQDMEPEVTQGWMDPDTYVVGIVAKSMSRGMLGQMLDARIKR